ncbi:lipopolysaccharide biosynthesis protein [Macellibacteroides sp. HH-ZS]|nr:lipopolysaccharide biosynthesis protein [Macellibacteroides sp. HH-ZS]
MSSTKQTVFANFVWKFFEKISVQLFSFIVTIVLARILCPNDYGIIAMITVFINLANVIIDGGLSSALIQKKDTNETDFSTIFVVSLLVSSMLYVILYFSANSIAVFYSTPSLVLAIRVLSVTLFLYAYNSIQRAYIAKKMLFKKLFLVNFVSVILSGILGVVLAYKGFGLWALIWYNITTSALSTFFTALTINWRPSFQISVRSFRELFGFGWKIFITNILTSLFTNIRSLIIGKVYTSGMLAYFDRGKQLSSLLMDNINSSMQTVLFPVLSNEQDDFIRVKSMIRRSISVSCLFSFPLMIGLFATARPLILILLTEKWIGAVPFVQIFCVSYLLYPMQVATQEAIKSLGYSEVTLKVEIIKKIAEVLILIVTVSISAYAIAIGVILFNLISLVINFYPNFRYLSYSPIDLVKDCYKPLCAALLMGFCIYPLNYLNINTYFILLIQMLFGVFLYYIFCLLFRNENIMYIKDTIISALKN